MICKWCGKEFTPQDKRSLYCSKECSKEAIKKRSRDNAKRYYAENKSHTIKTCVICGAEFEAKQGGAVVCGNECRQEYNRRKANEYYLKNKDLIKKKKKKKAEKVFYKKTCTECGKIFTASHHTKSICSPECFEQRRLRYQREYRELNPKKNEAANTEKILYKRTCTEYGEIFTTAHHKKTICSSKCFEERRLRHQRECRKLNPKRDEAVNDTFEVVKQKPLDGTVLEKAEMTVDEYNKAHGTNYSYGYYVHYIESKGV